MENPFLQVQLDRIDNKKLKLSWRSTQELGRVEVFWSPSPEHFQQLGSKLTDESALAASLVFQDPNPGQRTYYHLKSQHGAVRTVAERRLPLDGMANLRDLGGYRTEDGRYTKWGLLFRSEQCIPSELTERDHVYLKQCGIQLICDYRGDEVESMFSYPEWGNVRRVRIPIVTTESLEPSERLILANRNYVLNHTKEFATLFQQLLSERGVPVVQHCVAGKDRTGFGSAILLMALGVPEQTIMEDYLLTNLYKDSLYKKLIRTVQPNLTNQDDSLMFLFEVRPEYLQAAFDEIHLQYGTIEGFLEKGLGLTAVKKQNLRNLLLTHE
ncbi:protein-tyrosine-phosphatase [Paenibacillus sp. LMG 31458]|uniref:Protein-tyrosine-phosphatase n=1 Tax=Paenibacillus phytorum TaxID=2654977 RepID=A0ABX1YA92_9BACL|nr:tyrosine-protein phosphatase [Paenibacillus phytorum]NOU76865.1 protein-tyrosine-phosphatase [Paenibacillus phytorum]